MSNINNTSVPLRRSTCVSNNPVCLFNGDKKRSVISMSFINILKSDIRFTPTTGVLFSSTDYSENQKQIKDFFNLASSKIDVKQIRSKPN